MFGTLVRKELKSIILSPKFAVTLAVCSILMLLSVYIGIQEYQQAMTGYETGVKLADQRMQERTSFHAVIDKTYRRPAPMMIFASGLSYDIGRWSEVSSHETVKLKNSAYSDDPIFAVFRFIDFVFIVQIIFSLLAILFTYDAINGERERGTLRLVFSNAVPRAQYILAKGAGVWLGLVVPLAIPILLCLLLVNLYSIPMTGADWSKLGSLMVISIAYFSLFIMLGILISSLSKRTSLSFLTGLVMWIGFVLIVPRTGVMAAGQIVSVPRLAEIEGLRGGYAQDKWAQFSKESEERWMDGATCGEAEDQEQDEAAMWARMQEEDSARKEVQLEIESFQARLLEDWNHRKERQRRLGFTLSRFSPSSAYQLAAMKLSGTDVNMKTRYEDALTEYRTDFNDYVDRKSAEAGTVGGLMITLSSEDGVTIGSDRDNNVLDLSDRPRFREPEQQLGTVLAGVAGDFGQLVILTILAFAGAFVSFLRYDLR